MWFSSTYVLSVWLLFSTFCSSGWAEALPSLHFTDVTAESGIDLTLVQQPPQTGEGMVVLYWDQDALPDLIVSGGTELPLKLYRNEGNMVFSEVPMETSGLWFVEGDPRGLAAADYDNDGDTDLFVSNWGENKSSHLFRNDDGKFHKITDFMGLIVPGDASGGAWGDYDNDGFLDLYVGRYWGEQNHLYHNNQNGTFSEVAKAIGLDQTDLEAYPLTIQAMWVDVNRDGLVDLLEMNDRCYNGFAHNLLWINNGGTFTEESAKWGLDLCFDAMGIGLNDFNRDGFFDLFVSNVPDGHYLMEGGCNGFTDQTLAMGVLTEQWGWGVIFDDLNHDRFPDIYVAHAGYINFEDANVLYQGNANGPFTNVASQSDAGVGDLNSSAVIRADFDLDGDQDLIVGGIQGDSHTVLRNDSEVQNYLAIELRGTVSNRDGVGAWVEVFSGGIWDKRPRVMSDVYAGNNDPALLFGLGEAKSVDRIVVFWPSGLSETLVDVPINSRILIEEGSGEPWDTPLWVERCGDGIDNDCDGSVDEGFDVGAFCVIGIGECMGSGIQLCNWAKDGTVCSATPKMPTEEVLGDGLDNDCDGAVDELPEAPECADDLERCADGIDNDCDGSTDEGFELWGQVCVHEVQECISYGLWECDETNLVLVCSAPLDTGTTEICGDFQDNDCDGETDEGFSLGETCSTGVGPCVREGIWVCDASGIASLCNAEAGEPEVERCGDGVDNDCDGGIDEGFPTGTECMVEECPELGVWGCSADGLDSICLVSVEGLKERCGDELDNDCDGQTDEDFVLGGECWVGEGVCRRKGSFACDEAGFSVVCTGTPGTGTPEKVNDGLDNDCDGETDEVEDAKAFPTPLNPEDTQSELGADSEVDSASGDSVGAAQTSGKGGGCQAIPGDRRNGLPPLVLWCVAFFVLGRVRFFPFWEHESPRNN